MSPRVPAFSKPSGPRSLAKRQLCCSWRRHYPRSYWDAIGQCLAVELNATSSGNGRVLTESASNNTESQRQKRGDSLVFKEITAPNAALFFRTRRNTPYAELGIRGIFCSAG